MSTINNRFTCPRCRKRNRHRIFHNQHGKKVKVCKICGHQSFFVENLKDGKLSL